MTKAHLNNKGEPLCKNVRGLYEPLTLVEHEDKVTCARCLARLRKRAA